MKRYAFIDVQNTASTAERMLGFVIDWVKLVDYLKNSRSCTEVYLYSGINNGDLDINKEFNILSYDKCCILKTKSIFAYKNKNKKIKVTCVSCGGESIQTIDMGITKKSNCDVELSVDLIDKSTPESEIILFTGDGDFEYLIRKALERGVRKVYIFSYAEKYIKLGSTISRFSSKLRNLIAEKRDVVYYVSLRDIKEKIRKDIPIEDTGQ